MTKNETIRRLEKQAEDKANLYGFKLLAELIEIQPKAYKQEGQQQPEDGPGRAEARAARNKHFERKEQLQKELQEWIGSY